jgi:hypothetical protein
MKTLNVMAGIFVIIEWLYTTIATIFVLWSGWASYQEGSLFVNRFVLFSWVVVLLIVFVLLRGLLWSVLWGCTKLFGRQATVDHYQLVRRNQP